MDSQKAESARHALEELNRRFHARKLAGKGFYAQLMEQGFAHGQCVLVSLVPDGANTYVGKIIRQDGRMFEFDVDLDVPALSSWTDVSENFERELRAGRFKPWAQESLAYAEHVRIRDRIGGLDT